ncbi:hypothetical protein CHLRE_12g511952v5 [Chlamydomonas reinhardtii]|uniref:Uncharacterized protein n=1 Tax=Chlamydomonas reinhardtii TaxID=3055 RepID=A0A2K3D2H9_CHLRE|nr:uncharacterized protein CHLRE_12g511952v5 [Chlamydomonas reinhardtii]PNW74743.1 hypothetical protein CHLRE_12g511952v5 [Chlamydomonas reinhardtii]
MVPPWLTRATAKGTPGKGLCEEAAAPSHALCLARVAAPGPSPTQPVCGRFRVVRMHFN